MDTLSIGSHQPNGEFLLLATLNNRGPLLPQKDFLLLAEHVAGVFSRTTGQPVVTLAREDAPHSVDLEG